MRKATSKLPGALKAMENIVIDTADLDVHLKQMTESLNSAGIGVDTGYVALAGRDSAGSGWVQVNISSARFRQQPAPSVLPEHSGLNRSNSS